MEALLSALIGSALSELGDKTQLLALALALHFRRDGAVLAGIALAAILNAALAAVGGALVAPMLNREAATLMLGIALASAAWGMAMRMKPPPSLASWKVGAFASSFLAFGIAELGDKTQFLTFAIAARTADPLLAAAGGALGVIAMSAAAVAGGRAFTGARPIAAIRWAISGLFLVLAAIAVINAFQLI